MVKPTNLSPEDHKARHADLHRALDELIADWMLHTGKRLSSSTVLELLEWSCEQTENPTEVASPLRRIK